MLVLWVGAAVKLPHACTTLGTCIRAPVFLACTMGQRHAPHPVQPRAAFQMMWALVTASALALLSATSGQPVVGNAVSLELSGK